MKCLVAAGYTKLNEQNSVSYGCCTSMPSMLLFQRVTLEILHTEL